MSGIDGPVVSFLVGQLSLKLVSAGIDSTLKKKFKSISLFNPIAFHV